MSQKPNHRQRRKTPRAISSPSLWDQWLVAGRLDVFRGKHPKLNSARAYLLGIKNARDRSFVRAAMRKRVGGSWSRLNGQLRESLHDSIFEVMNRIESKNGGQSEDPRVIQLCIAMNLVADDLGWNDQGGDS